jgi:hypothetical protein
VRDNEAPTLRQFKIPTVLVIGGTDALITAVSEAALSLQVLVAECGIEDATTTAANMRPLVIIISEDVYQSDGEGFEALATDIRAGLMRVDTAHCSSREIEARMTELMAEAEAKRPSWTGDLGR